MADVNLGTIAAYLRLQTAEFFSGLEKAGAAVTAFGEGVNKDMGLVAGHSQSLSTAMMAAGAGIAGALALGVKAGGDFQKKILEVGNNTTMTAAQIRQMQEDVQNLGRNSAAPLDKLAEGYMHVVNFGFKPGAQAVDILNAAMRSAVATGGDTGRAADVLANVMHEFSIRTGEAGRAMNVLHLAAAQGNMTLEQFDEAAGPALGMAANLGLGLTDVGAAMSALTRHGFDAAEAATQVRSILSHIVNPAHQVREELAQLSKTTGIDLVGDFSSAGLKAKGLSGVMADLAEVHRRTGVDIMKLIPALRGGVGAMVLAGTGAQDYRDILASLGSAMSGQVDPSAQGFERTQKTLAAQTQILKNNLVILASSVMTALGPSLVSLTQQITRAVQWFNNLSPGTKRAAIDFAAVAAGALTLAGGIMKIMGPIGTLISWFGKLGPVIEAVTVAWGDITLAFEGVSAGAATVAEGAALIVSALGGPVTLVIAGVVAASAGLVLAWKNDWGHIHEHTSAALDWLKSNVPAAWNWLKSETAVAWSAVRGTIGNALGAVRSLVDQVLPELQTTFREVFGTLAPWLRVVWDVIKAEAQEQWIAIKTALSVVWDGIVGVFRIAWDTIKGITLMTWDVLKGIIKTGVDLMAGTIRIGLRLLRGDWQGAWDLLKQYGAKVWNDITTMFSGFLKHLVAMVVGWGRDLADAGRNAAHALGQGLRDGIASAAASARDMAQHAVDAVKSTLQIHSPSAVFLEIGRNIALAMAQGMGEGTPAIDAAAGKMGSTAKSGATGASATTGGLGTDPGMGGSGASPWIGVAGAIGQLIGGLFGHHGPNTQGSPFMGASGGAGGSDTLHKILAAVFGSDGSGGLFGKILAGVFGKDGKGGKFGGTLDGAFGSDGKGGIFGDVLQSLMGSLGGGGGGAGGLGSLASLFAKGSPWGMVAQFGLGLLGSLMQGGGGGSNTAPNPFMFSSAGTVITINHTFTGPIHANTPANAREIGREIGRGTAEELKARLGGNFAASLGYG